MKTWYAMRAAADSPAEILIYDEIGSWGISANQFVQDLRALGEVSAIDLRINSPGGGVFEGLAIYNALCAHSAKVTVYVDGIAASIASVIAMCGDEIVMPENAMLMIHDPSGACWGTAEDMRRVADALDKAKQSLISAYRRCGLSDEEISALMSDETWMSAQDALDKGFCTKVEKPVKMAAVFDLTKFRHAPADLVAALARGPAAHPPVATPGGSMSDMSKPAGQQPPAGTTPPTAADPAAIARACMDAGFPDLTASLIEAQASMDRVTARIAEARQIKDVCAKANLGADLQAKYLREGASLEAVRAAAFDVLSARDAATIVNGTPPAPGTGGAKRPSIDATAIYRNFNRAPGAKE